MCLKLHFFKKNNENNSKNLKKREIINECISFFENTNYYKNDFCKMADILIDS